VQAIPALEHTPEVAAYWIPKLTSGRYDPRNIPSEDKLGCTMGMSMTEKQGGSDVRSNTTIATPIGPSDGLQQYSITGHKWFTSAPMCDAFLSLANTPEGLSCFLVPRWLPDGSRNSGFKIMRLKEKLGDRSNASSEIEYDRAWAVMVGQPGKGVKTILDMVVHTRLDCGLGSAGLMRQAVRMATHHVSHRSAFGKTIADHGAMRNVLADIGLESEAALRMVGHLGFVALPAVVLLFQRRRRFSVSPSPSMTSDRTRAMQAPRASFAWLPRLPSIGSPNEPRTWCTKPWNVTAATGTRRNGKWPDCSGSHP
jgi:putative acyl-CoA dehydrogenase